MKALKRNDIIILLIALVSQAILGIWAKDDMISFISGISGIISVVLCSQRKISFYLFGFIQLITYVVIVSKSHLWGELVENIFYFVTMIVGIVLWIKNYDKKEYQVKSKSLTQEWKIACLLTFLLGTIFVWLVLSYTNDAYPFLDSISTVPAFIAQILMITGYREQWRYWLIVDVSSIVMWAIIGNPFMIVQFSLWTLNCIYGMYKWKEN